jgi:hypothetical protein
MAGECIGDSAFGGDRLCDDEVKVDGAGEGSGESADARRNGVLGILESRALCFDCKEELSS